MKQIPIGERWVIAGCLVVLAYIIGAVCWSCWAKKAAQTLSTNAAMLSTPSPTPLPSPSPEQSIYIWFVPNKTGGMYVYVEDPTKEQPYNRIVKCALNPEYVQSANYTGWLKVPSQKCREVLP